MSQTKKCVNCGAIVLEEEQTCPSCGSVNFEADLTQTGLDTPAEASEPKHENVAAGIVGALLFSLIGVALYFGIYQLGFIAGICGFVIFVLANFGYGLFCGNKNSVSIARILTAIIMTIIMIFLAEYICAAFEIFMAFKEEGEPISFVTALRVIPALFEEREFVAAFAKDLLIAYALGILASISSVIKMFKDRKAMKQ